MDSDVLIIGGGIIGLSIARKLRLRGLRRITVLDRGQFGREASFAAAGMLAPQAESNRIDDFFRICDESNRLYPDFAAELLDETGLDIEFEPSGTLYLAFTENDAEEVRERYKWQKAAGLEIEHLDSGSAKKLEPFISPAVREALFFPNDRQVDNRKLVSALVRFAVLNRIKLVTDAEVIRLSGENGAIIGVETNNGSYNAEKVVLAAGAWTSLIKNDALTLPAVKPIRGQMLEFSGDHRLMKHVIYSPRGYLVPRIDGRILAGATTEDVGFNKGITESGIEIVKQNGIELAPGLANIKISEKWAGLRPAAGDGLPILGAISEAPNLIVATAHFRNGILLAPITGEIIADLIVDGKSSAYLKSFGPQRFPGSG